jgi:tetratricopeptide (TPR) repeat protein
MKCPDPQCRHQGGETEFLSLEEIYKRETGTIEGDGHITGAKKPFFGEPRHLNLQIKATQKSKLAKECAPPDPSDPNYRTNLENWRNSLRCPVCGNQAKRRFFLHRFDRRDTLSKVLGCSEADLLRTISERVKTFQAKAAAGPLSGFQKCDYGTMLFRLGDIDASLEVLRSALPDSEVAIEQDPENAWFKNDWAIELYGHIADCLILKGQLVDARNHASKMLQLARDPANVQFYHQELMDDIDFLERRR